MIQVVIHKNTIGLRVLKKALNLVLFVVLVLLGCSQLPMTGQSITGTARVIDGDTLEIENKKFRLFGIDAPESKQTCKREGRDYACGKEAAEVLEKLIGDQEVTCEKKEVDRYRRFVATCFIGEKDLNKEMVLNGYALAYRDYSWNYVPDEEQAKAARAGIWSGSFKKPWDFRHKKQDTPK